MYSNFPDIQRCQEAADTPYCWPPNGSYLCLGFSRTIPLYWPSTYYNSNASLSIDFGTPQNNGSDQAGEVSAITGNIRMRGYDNYTEPVPGSSGNADEILYLTIRERFTSTNGSQEIVHPGPTLILTTRTSTDSATPTATAESNKAGLTTGKIIGLSFGAGILAILFGMVLYSCCTKSRPSTSSSRSCCGCQGDRETKRIKRLQARRIQQERAYVQEDVDAIKASVARGEIWRGPVRPGGIWVSHSNWPASPPRASGDPDEIMPVEGQSAEVRRLAEDLRLQREMVEEQRAELDRIEQEMVEEQRVELNRVEQRRREIAVAEETEPPAYEPPPPRYTP